MNRIKALRSAANMQQKDLAELLNVAPNSICRYEKGDRGLDSDVVCRLCDIFQCTADYLLCRSELRSPEMTERQRQLLEAYDAAPPYSRGIVDAALEPYMQKEKSAVS